MSLEFQIYDWIEDHEIEENESESEEGEKDMIGSYIIHTFGRNIDGKSVYMKVVNYTPHFYIKLPLNWNKMDASINVKKMYTYLISDSNKKIWKKYRSSLQSMDVVERMDAEGFTDEKTFLFARLIFTNSIAMSKYRYMFEGSTLYIPGVTVKSMSFKLYEANILAMLRCFHIRKVSGCSWIKIDTYKIVERDEDKESYCNVEIRVDWRNIIPITKNVNAPFRIMSFDIECYSCDNNFPQAIRSTDCITMIGSTYTMLGEASPYRQHIVCLKDTDNVEGVIVESYKSEAEMLLGWIDEIRKNDCDILTGYNIFFFDENYIYERCMLLNLTHDIMRISKLKNFECKFRDFNLASSALGENRIRMFNTPGRIHIDLMKDVQKNHKLSCYKLDFVASSFIRDTINYINFENNTMELKCNGINDICIGDFIHIEYALDFISDMIGGKYNVTSINKIDKKMTIEGNLSNLNEFINKSEYREWVDMNKNDRKFKLWWCQAKDDMEVKDIFRSYKGSPSDRGIVAKYCIKDCKLVGLLMDKLNVVTNNIEMSNVCYVPMSFLFTRGQTIKLFSLVLKEFRENGYLFPVLKKPDIKIPSYEGAIVFDPEPTVDYEALAVNDYASLYPSSIIEMNMSIETKVKLDRYDNLPSILYHSADFRDHDGTIQHRRFAMKNNKLGVIPTILTNLLNERAVVKKIMKTEKNFFTAKILDGKQLALKVTANSLYGALGAETSPILDRDIAACTTSIGRKRLILAKNFVENIVPQFFNGLRIAWNEGDDIKANRLISMEVKKIDNKLIERLKKFVTKDISDYTYQPIVRYGDTDSIFTCYRFRENTRKIKDDDSLILWKEIIKFSKKLLIQFLPEEHHEMWNSLHSTYYGEINNNSVPSTLIWKELSTHYKNISPIKDRMEQFMLQYMEGIMLSWLWTLQDILTKEYVDIKIKDEMIEDKLFKTGHNMIESMKIIPRDIIDEDKISIIHMVESFIKHKLKNYIVTPYWDIVEEKRITKIIVYKNGTKIIDKRALINTIEMGILAGDFIKNYLPFPHDCKYEKTFWPFLILSKKRYVGNKYEEDPGKYKQDFNGIVLKRRDNAPIVKEICGGIINYLINEKDPLKAKLFTIDCMRKMFNNMYNIKYFQTSKTLKPKESYKCKNCKRSCPRAIEQGIIMNTIEEYNRWDMNYKNSKEEIRLRIKENSVKCTCNDACPKAIEIDRLELLTSINKINGKIEKIPKNEEICTCEAWKKFAHCVLAERIALRNPGDSPQSGDRIEFAVVKIPNLTKTTLQGERIETPEYIKTNNLVLDYEFYMTNQIMKPALQFLELVIPNAKNIFDEFKLKIENNKKEKTNILDFCKKLT
jgi:DNA polymerase elongation subunit (family B)